MQTIQCRCFTVFPLSSLAAKKKILKNAKKGTSSPEDNPTNGSTDAAMQLASPALRKKRSRTEESEENKEDSMAFSDEDDLSEDEIMDDYGVASSSDEEVRIFGNNAFGWLLLR